MLTCLLPLARPMARRVLVAAGLAACLLPGAAQAERISVVLDQAKVMSLPQGTRTVVVGNPAIADVTVQKNGIIVITGKTYGATNLIALDTGGKIMAESALFVEAPSEGLVTVQRGLERESYSCTPRCAPTMVPGDATAFFTSVGAQTQQRNQLANPNAK
jgi:Flp pilus assembly secretin CpaC